MRRFAFVSCLMLTLCSCSSYGPSQGTSSMPAPIPKVQDTGSAAYKPKPNYASRMPSSINPLGEKVIIVNPNVHAWGAYDANGNLLRGGLATAGGDWCPDINRRCHTRSGSFRIQSLGSASCKSSMYPLPRGGAPMPYCMFFNGHQGLHGSYNVVDGNASHGCVRLQVGDAEWIRFNFARVGTKVIVKSY
jgi:hypothetical protein